MSDPIPDPRQPSPRDALKQDLDYIASAVRRRDVDVGVPIIYFLWALIVPIGFALPELAPRYAAPFWWTAGIGGGLLSMWLGGRDERQHGIRDTELGKRYGYHWLLAAVAFALAGLPMLLGRVPAEAGASYFLLLTGLIYAYAGLHLNRPMLCSGLMMLAAYAVMVVLQPPYAWTMTGLVVAVALVLAGLSAQRARRAGTLQ